MTRLFVGTFVEESHRKRLADFKEANRDLESRWQRKLRWVHSEKLHMTWYFIGDVEAESVREVEQDLESALHRSPPPRFALRFDTLELWPNARKCRQLVLCTKKFSPGVSAVAEQITRACLKYARPDAKHYDTFKPHVTLLRLDAPRSRSAERPDLSHLKDLLSSDPFVLDVSCVSLIESDLGRSNKYVSLKDYKLASD